MVAPLLRAPASVRGLRVSTLTMSWCGTVTGAWSAAPTRVQP